MQYYLAREGVAFGPYTEHQIRESVRLGIFYPNDLALAADGEQWLDVATLLPPISTDFGVTGTESAIQPASSERQPVIDSGPATTLLSGIMSHPLSKKIFVAFAALQLVEACLLGGVMLIRHESPIRKSVGAVTQETHSIFRAQPLGTKPGEPAAPVVADAATDIPTPDPMPVANLSPSIEVDPTLLAEAELKASLPPAAELLPSSTAAAPSRQIEGRIFVASTNGMNYQPSAVEVRLYPLATLKPYLEKRNAEASAQFADLKAQIKAAEAEKEQLRIASNAAFDAYARSDAHAANRRALEQANADAKKAREKATNDYYELLQQREDLLSGEFYLEELPSPAATTRTDSGGKFVFQVPQDGEFAVVAGAEKHVGRDVAERYYWFLPVSLDGEPSKSLLLSNNNLSSQGSPDSLVLTVD